MSNQNTRAEKLKVLFATHPKVDLFYLTSDDVAFFEKHKAEAYAQRLADQTVTPHTRVVAQAIENLKQKMESETEKGKETEAVDNSNEVEKADLEKKYEELIGSKAPANIKLDTLKKRVAEAEAEAEKEN